MERRLFCDVHKKTWFAIPAINMRHATFSAVYGFLPSDVTSHNASTCGYSITTKHVEEALRVSSSKSSCIIK
jgi:hypothetical protein